MEKKKLFKFILIAVGIIFLLGAFLGGNFGVVAMVLAIFIGLVIHLIPNGEKTKVVFKTIEETFAEPVVQQPIAVPQPMQQYVVRQPIVAPQPVQQVAPTPQPMSDEERQELLRKRIKIKSQREELIQKQMEALQKQVDDLAEFDDGTDEQEKDQEEPEEPKPVPARRARPTVRETLREMEMSRTKKKQVKKPAEEIPCTMPGCAYVMGSAKELIEHLQEYHSE